MKGGHAWALRLLLAAAVLAVEASFIDEAAAAEAASGGDSLRSALEAVNRRQRDLATTLGGGVARSLTDYRLRPDAVGAPDLAFLAPPRDFVGDGQPENIGYGYQKSSAAGTGGEGGAGSRAAERQLLEYLSGYLEANGAGDKRSAFRERSGLRPPMTLRKRKPLPLPRPSAFRERTRGDLQVLEALQARKREHGGADADELLREAEAEAEQEEERQREEEEEEAAAEEEAEEIEEERRRRQEQQDEEEREAEYLQLLQALWRKYQTGGLDGRREEELTPEDLQELLASAGDTGDIDKRQYGGFDYFNNAGALGGWQTGGMYRKRGGRQRLEGGAPSGAGFLYALKFASPAAQREALEALAEEDAAEMGDERDEDAVRAAAAAAVANAAGAGARRMTPIEWERAAEAEAAAEAAAEDAFGPQIPGGPDDYQRLFAEGPSARKRFAYDGALLAAQRKRYPVTKRSSDFYASPPLMHRRSSAPPQSSAFAPHDELRRKKDASNGATDPKVASELNQIFGGDGSGDGSGGGSSASSEHHTHSTTTPESSSSASAGGAPPGAAPPTSPPSGNGSRELTPEEQRARNHHHGEEEAEEGSEGADEEQEVPLALSRVQGPPGGRLQVKKKSVDWSQYFGLDRRRKKADSGDRDARWLMDRYRALALAAGTVKRTGGPPALDMRRFDAGGDIFARNSRQHSGGESPSGRLDGVDTKLLGMEDLIVNEAVKLTGANQGATDPTEVQQVKDRILARLAAAYSLEKMRLALREFKSSLQAQKMSRYNPENKQTEEDKKKRVAVKKEKAEEKEDAEDETEVSTEDKDEDEEKKKRLAVKKVAEEAEEATEFLGSPRGIEPMSEGYMGHSQTNDVGGECAALESLQGECRAVAVSAGDRAFAFLPLCTLHQICHVCGPTVGAPSPGACDTLFAREAALGCGDDPGCALAARRTAARLPRRPPAPPAPAAPEHCWPGSCLVQRFLTATLGARLR